MLSLNDVLTAPDDPELLRRHLQTIGALAPPAPPLSLIAPAKVTEKLSPVAAPVPSNAVKPMAPLVTQPTLEPSAAASVAEPGMGIKPLTSVQPTVAESITAGMGEHGTTAKEEGKRQFQELRPQVTAAPDSVEGLQQQRAQQVFDQTHPWGGEISAHPGVLGKIGHVLGRIGNIAGDIVAPGTMANIPGTDINKGLRAERTQEALAGAQTRELAGETEKTREKHEENVADVAQQKLENAEETNKNKDSATLARQGLMRDEKGEIVADEKSPIYQAGQAKLKGAEELRTNLNAYRQAQTDLAKARTEMEKAKNDPNSPAFKAAQQKLAMAQEAHAVAAKNLELHEAQFATKEQEKELVKPSGQAQSRGSAAQAVIDLIPDLKTLVNKHREDMGPVMGRLNRGEVAIGNVDPEIARLYAAMKSFYALQPAVHGFRNAEFVKDFEHALGTLERDPDSFIAGMEGLKPTLESVAKEGKTFHKRIVEGKEGGPGAAAPAEPPRAPKEGMKWQRNKTTGEFREVPGG